MPPTKKSKKAAAARARAARHPQKRPVLEPETGKRRIRNTPSTSGSSCDRAVNELPDVLIDLSLATDESDCGYDGGIEVETSSADEYVPRDGSEDFTDTEISEYDAKWFAEELGSEMEALERRKKTMFEQIQEKRTAQEWKTAETGRNLGYNGNGKRTRDRREAEARQRDKKRKEAKTSKDPQILMMRTMFSVTSAAPAKTTPVESPLPSAPAVPEMSAEELNDYLSDRESEDEEERMADDEMDEADSEGTCTAPSHRLPIAPPLKRRKLVVPARQTQADKRTEHIKVLSKAHTDIKKHIHSIKTHFDGGRNSLQEYRARAIQSCLSMAIKSGRITIADSEVAAKSHGFASKWGGRNVRFWAREWIRTRTLPISRKGQHAKVYSLLNEPGIKAELRTYLRSNKWAVDPEKLRAFTMGQLIPAAAEKYLTHLVEDEMPRGLKKYMELEIFPRIQLKAGNKGVSIITARRWLLKEGFKFISHKKGLYFDGHDRPDVVDYRQTIFLPAMEEYARRTVRYVVGDVAQEAPPLPDGNFVERRLVVVSHDEMTAQANDAAQRRWVFEDQHALRKKGAGRGIHRSDIICSTVGHITEAGVQLEYGKNHDGYWTGEHFIDQIQNKIIGAFEDRHGPGYQMLLMTDHSQGHSVYAEDALLVSRMNVNPGGKQAHMRDGWFTQGFILISPKA
ncbi:unnamed protein product [Mycena citricolor]|uniref:Uncharacterized protein n=1 Tax=Mycena citricolor TaxID=2018698 RepID=A0AAD2H2M7_9AGAR|nr:unnamed protein product [Mycena citricolor]